MNVSPCNGCDKVCPDAGCAAWRKWFIRYWNENICRLADAQKKRDVFQYEHPDRAREMTAAEWMAKQMEAKEDAK